MTTEPNVIMLVDDDFDFLTMNRSVFETNGFRVVCVHAPGEALAQMAEHRPDLVVTDLMMQDLDSGFSLARQIKDDPRFGGVPVILVTAIGSIKGFDISPRTSADFEAMCVDAYFEKPVDAGVLVAKVRELLGESGGKGPT